MYIFYLLILSGYIFSRGFFSYNSFFITLGVCILYPIILIRKNIRNKLDVTPSALLIILSVLSIVMYGGLYQRNSSLIILSFILILLNLFLSLRLALSENNQASKKIFYAMLGIFSLLRLFMIWSSPDPYIDVYDFLKKGALGFAAGHNPYTLTYTKLYSNTVPDYYWYPPGMIYLTMPSVLLFGDPRYTLIVSEFLTAFVVYRICKKNKDRFIYPLIVLSNPISLYMVEQSYTEPIILMLLVIFAWCLVKNRRTGAILSFGLTIATKQYIVFLLPLIFRLAVRLRKILIITAGSVGIAAVIIAPFYFWSSKDFLHDTIFLQMSFPPRYEGLTLFSFLHEYGINYNFILGSIFMASGLIFAYTRKKISVSRFFYLSSFSYLFIFFFNKWAFINYYYLISQLLLIGAILETNSIKKEENET